MLPYTRQGNYNIYAQLKMYAVPRFIVALYMCISVDISAQNLCSI